MLAVARSKIVRWNRVFGIFRCRTSLQPQLQPADVSDAQEVNDLSVEAAVKLGLEDGSKLRIDTTVKPRKAVAITLL
jgi:hypothetical protein